MRTMPQQVFAEAWSTSTCQTGSMHAQLKQCISLNDFSLYVLCTRGYEHNDFTDNKTIIVSSYDFICSDIVVDCNNYSSVYLMWLINNFTLFY